MKNNNLFSVQLRESEVYYVRDNGENFVLIRPICDVFQLDADWQIRSIKEDEILGAEVCEHTTQLPHDIQKRQHTCLPEKMVYGWLLGIKFTNTMSQETKSFLSEYKRECYEVLYNHFHGNLQVADNMLKEKARLNTEIRAIHKKLLDTNEDYRTLIEKEAMAKSFGSPYIRYQNQQYKLFCEELVSNN